MVSDVKVHNGDSSRITYPPLPNIGTTFTELIPSSVVERTRQGRTPNPFGRKGHLSCVRCKRSHRKVLISPALFHQTDASVTMFTFSIPVSGVLVKISRV
jgi:hypothetical protein